MTSVVRSLQRPILRTTFGLEGSMRRPTLSQLSAKVLVGAKPVNVFECCNVRRLADWSPLANSWGTRSAQVGTCNMDVTMHRLYLIVYIRETQTFAIRSNAISQLLLLKSLTTDQLLSLISASFKGQSLWCSGCFRNQGSAVRILSICPTRYFYW